MSWRRYVAQACSLPPRIIWRKAQRKVKNHLKRNVGRMQARVLGTDLSKADFLAALDSRFPTIQTFLDHMAAREEPYFFLDCSHRREFIEAIRACCPEAEGLTVAAAGQVCDQVFDLLGSGPTHLGEQIDWHVDFKTGHRFNPDKYYADVRPAPYPGGYDIKVPWELSRCQHFSWLGQAYWFTDDKKYIQEFVDQVLDWIEQNPPQFGVNWACTMDVAIRAVNWLWGYYFFKDSPRLNDEFSLAFFKSLLAHGQHIFRNLENQGDFTGNHYLSNLVGLVYLGILCPEFKEARRWREFGLQELEKEMFKQVYPDGVDFEASTSYHRLVTEMFLSAVILAQLNDHNFSRPFMERLEKMLEFVMYVTKPDGTAPLIGDNDNGRLHRLKVWDPPEREWVDFRHLLAIGAVLFERDDLAQAAGDQWEEAIWLFGQKALGFRQKVEAKETSLLRLESRAFFNSGLYIMRHDGLHMVIDAGTVGQNGNGGHAHNDMLGFELYQAGRVLVGDPGTFAYTADYEMRNRFRSSDCHNVMVVDEEEINRFPQHDPFKMYDDVQPRCLLWETERDYDLLITEHTAYMRLPQPVTYRRWFYVDKSLPGVLVGDYILGAGNHRLQVNFQCLSQCQVETVGLMVIGRWPDTMFIAYPVRAEGWQIDIIEGDYAPGYGLCRAAPRFRYTWAGQLPTKLVLYWQAFQSSRLPEKSELRNRAERTLNAIRRLVKPELRDLGDSLHG